MAIAPVSLNQRTSQPGVLGFTKEQQRPVCHDEALMVIYY
jgi:hypothetical protein